jgi:cation:H+ antiporter
MFFIWIKFIVCAGIIFFAGKRVAKYGDIIAEKTGLGGLWIGATLVAICTSLPEIFTGIGSIIFVDAPDLTIGNLFGANTYNLLNIALLDFLHKGSPLLNTLSVGQLLTAGLSLVPLLIAMTGIFLSSRLPSFGIFHISIYSVLILVAYLVSARIIFSRLRRDPTRSNLDTLVGKFERKEALLKELQEEQEAVFTPLETIGREEKTKMSLTGFKYKEFPLKKAFLFYGISACVIVVAGIWLAYIGDELAQNLGWQRNFVGSLFLGFATTLPEITVSAAAIYLGAKELAVANMLGSNLFNMSIIFINDALYKKAHIFKVISENHLFSGLVVIFMTAIVIASLILKPKDKKRWRLSSYSLALILVFMIGAYINFCIGN